MQKFTLTLFLALLPFFLFSQDTTTSKKWGYQGYSGGMSVHAGFVQSKYFTVFDLQGNEIGLRIKDFTFGLGGKMSIYLNKYFRVGGEGYFSTCKYGTSRYLNQFFVSKSSCRIGWGGVALDLIYPMKKWAASAGITVGGGSATNLIFTQYNNNPNVAMPIVLFTYPLCIISPAVGVEFFTSKRISLLCKIDYMFNVYKTKFVYQPENTYPQGLRFYLGVHFYQKK
jgi:hypothetical protein